MAAVCRYDPIKSKCIIICHLKQIYFWRAPLLMSNLKVCSLINKRLLQLRQSLHDKRTVGLIPDTVCKDLLTATIKRSYGYLDIITNLFLATAFSWYYGILDQWFPSFFWFMTLQSEDVSSLKSISHVASMICEQFNWRTTFPEAILRPELRRLTQVKWLNWQKIKQNCFANQLSWAASPMSEFSACLWSMAL